MLTFLGESLCQTSPEALLTRPNRTVRQREKEPAAASPAQTGEMHASMPYNRGMPPLDVQGSFDTASTDHDF